MKILAKWSIALTMALTVGFTAVETKVEAAPDPANNSHQSFNQNSESRQINQFISEADQTTPQTTKKIEASSLSAPLNAPLDEKKLISKTVMTSRRSAVRSFRATAYCLKGRTASGGSVRRGVVAADRRMLPLGTKIYVDAGAYSGMYTVADTGGAIKGNILDIWVPNCAEATRFGRKAIGVSVVQ